MKTSQVRDGARTVVEDLSDGEQAIYNEREPEPFWFSTSSGRIEFTVPPSAVQDISRSGPNDDAVEHWAPKIKRPPSATPAVLAKELREYGAWDAEELKDDSQNWRRIVWLAAWDIADGKFD